MRSPLPRRFLASLVAVALLAAACSSGDDGADEADLQSVTVTTAATTTSTTAATTTTEAPSESSTTTAAPLPASGEAIAFKSLAPDIVGVSDGVLTFVEGLEPVRVDQLAAVSCGAVGPSMGAAELGVEGFSTYETLSPDEQARLSLDDWVVLFGALLGYFCPDNLPDLDLETTPTEGTEVERFRTIVTEVSGVSAETEAFVATLSDERLDALQQIACDASSSELTTEDFGVIIVRSYDADLDVGEQSGIGLAAYSELYGALVGWFCPGNLPR
jgi:uncharacterized protein YdbL (DUF1318 family)